MSTLNTVFKQVFNEALVPLGFIKKKGRHPCFLRLIGDEILQVITYINRPTGRRGHKEFTVMGGIATVYRNYIDLNITSSRNGNWFIGNLDICQKLNPLDYNRDMFNNLYSIPYNDETIANGVNYALKITKEYMLPIFNEVTDIDSCIKYYEKYVNYLMNFCYGKNFGNNNPNNSYMEWMLYVKTSYRGDFMPKLESREEYTTSRAGSYKGCRSYEEHCEAVRKNALEKRTYLDLILDNPDKYTEAMDELERRKTVNIEILKTNGLEI